MPKRTIVFIDGQNLFHAAREALGYTYPNYDVRALAARVCASREWHLDQTRFYTGIPDRQDDPRWHDFWSAKLAVMGRQGVHVYSRSRVKRRPKASSCRGASVRDATTRSGDTGSA